ncbi:MAG: hypothetical protein ACOY5F_01505 [Pseudomonadota bacterium]
MTSLSLMRRLLVQEIKRAPVSPALAFFGAAVVQQAPVPDVMHGVWPGWVMMGEPLMFGTLGRDAASGLPGLTAPGIPG